ncbi:hypothetical protein AAP_05685 [Ascosphaera apis ARSEF 7405]|uniref:Uncharacterized protein n=1 Tax=Ascosphaera apis ARSEF 7405 TaxID=392613 RepID=A0A162IDG2_9EURO|nr:hypothetical protein AAP_05685 [Ascosphaera apis ARSEF 7405]
MATLNHKERSRSEAMYTMAFGPHAANFSDVMKALEPQLKELDRGCDITINGRKLRLFSYPIGFLGDMPQQNENAGIQGPTGFTSCRWCLVDHTQRGNMEYDIVKNKRWLLNQEAIRDKAENARNETQGEKVRKVYGLSLQRSPITSVWKSCDPTSDFMNDPCHSELAGIMKIAANVLFNDILTPDGRTQLADKISNWVELRMIDAITFFFCGKIEKLTPATEEALVKVFADIAKSNRLLLSWTEEGADAEATMRVVKQARKGLQKLLQSVVAGLQIPNTRAGTAQSSAILTGAATPKRKNKNSRLDVVDRMRSRPNMHIALHYGEMIEDYGRANNGNVLLGEDRHRKFKAMVTQTNHRNPEKAMLMRDSANKTITTLLSGSRSGSRVERNLALKLHELEESCPTLMQKYRTRDGRDPEWRACNREPGRIGARVELGSTKLSGLDDGHIFMVQLMTAYGERMSLDIRRNAVIFWQKLTYNPRSHSKRTCVIAGDIVDIDGQKVLITTIFTHKLRNHSDEIFVSAIPMIQRRFDEMLQLPVLTRQQGGFQIFSARRITERPLYKLAIRRGPGKKLEEVDMNFPNNAPDMDVRWDHEFLLCPAELEIM